MTKSRHPFSTHDAVHIAIGELGLERATKVAGYQQPTTMYAFGNPEKERDISFDAACALDAACLQESGLTPFLDVLRHKLEGQGPIAKDMDISVALLDAFEDVSELSAKVREAAGAASPGGAAFTAAERQEINAAGGQLLNEIKMILAVVNGEDAVKRSPSLYERFTQIKADGEAA